MKASRKLVVLCAALLIGVSAVHGGGKTERDSGADAAWEIPFLNVLTGPIASIGGYLQWGAASFGPLAASALAQNPDSIIFSCFVRKLFAC